ncbi:hypothetical protein ACFVXE_18225 [Streptomyces sp. NPDC058231]|uniref:hypothetical protein n=1 Tax=Streptomyces sp. NPDC058231 TaxID=3346392 RepID=UPI0036E35679
MLVTWKAGLVVSAAVAMVAAMSTDAWGAGRVAVAAPVAAAAPAGGWAEPEADVSHHGHVSLWGSELGLWLHSENHGPSDLDGATVRLRFSAVLAGRQEMPVECLQADARTVLCRTGPLPADGSAGRQLALELRLAGRPKAVVVRIDTVWNGGATDRNLQNDQHQVSAFATGDEYVF